MTAIIESLRPLIFSLLDSVKGNKIHAHISDTDYVMKNNSSGLASERIHNRMEKILKHATTTTSFYKEYKSYNSVADFPVINKNIIRERFNDFISDKYPLRELIRVSTSGSTGTPFKLYHDRDKKKRHIADTIYFNQRAGFNLGMRLYFIRNWDERHMKSKLKFRMQNIVPVNTFNLTEERITCLIKTIRDDKHDKCLMGYPSSFETICKHMEENNVPPVRSGVRSIIAIAEALDGHTAASMEKYFSAPVFSRYANNENGIIAQQVINGGNEFFINSPGFYVEILKFDNDSPAGDANPGRIVVTDYFNFGMPMIRYDTGDIVISGNKKSNGNIFSVLTRIEGRKLDLIYDTSGRYVSPIHLTAGMWKHQDIKQYQIIQKDRLEYMLTLNCIDPYPGVNELKDHLKKHLGSDAIIRVEYVNEIPLLSSGKRKAIVNDYRTN